MLTKLRRSRDEWAGIVERMRALFGVRLEDPQYVKERGEIAMSYRDASGVRLDPFVRYVANQPPQARHRFYGLREAKPDLVGIAIYDRLEGGLPPDPNLQQRMWARREIGITCARERPCSRTPLRWREGSRAICSVGFGERSWTNRSPRSRAPLRPSGSPPRGDRI